MENGGTGKDFPFLKDPVRFQPDRSNFAYFSTISHSQAVKATTTYLLISNAACTAMLWVT